MTVITGNTVSYIVLRGIGHGPGRVPRDSDQTGGGTFHFFWWQQGLGEGSSSKTQEAGGDQPAAVQQSEALDYQPYKGLKD